MTEKQLPSSAEAERGVLGSVLLNFNCIHELDLTPLHFYDRRHSILWESMKAMAETGKTMDAITVYEWLCRNDTLEQIGGQNYLDDLTGTAVVDGHSKHYADIVEEKFLMRNLATLQEDGAKAAYEGDPLEVGSKAVSDLVSLLSGKQDTLTLSEYASEYVAKCKKGVAGTYPWWCEEWTSKLGKLSDEIVILHAPRSTGKTALMLEWAIDSHKRGLRTPIASIEMLRNKISVRLLTRLGSVNTLRMRSSRVTYDDESRSEDAIKEMDRLDFCVRDKAMSVADIRSFAILEQRNGLDALYIDNLLTINDGGLTYGSKTLMYDAILKKMRDLRDHIGVPIILLAHPNAEGGIKWSSDVEDIADVIVFLLRVPDDGFEVNGIHVAKRHDLIGTHVVARFQKNRDGICVAAELEFIGEIQKFVHLGWIE